jgi:hypothetical protein
MAEAKNTAKKEAVVETKKYITKSVLVDKGEVFQPDTEVEFAADKAERLLEIGAIAEAE